MQPQVEAEVRIQIDRRLRARGWVLDPAQPGQDVFVEGAVVPRLATAYQARLEGMRPDYTLFSEGSPIAVLEAKKPAVSIHDAIDQGAAYAERLDIDFVFACNGPTFKTLHLPSGDPLFLNKVEVTEPIPPGGLRNFWKEKTNSLVTVPSQVIESREELIYIFERLNDTLRSAGIRAGLDRFTEFANLLFLKILSERDEASELWSDLLHKQAHELPAYINNYVIDRLRQSYSSDVLSTTQIDGNALKELILELNPLRLSSVDEDVKGVAFEHFLRRTTAVQNDLGEYFTPRHVVHFMVRLLNPQFGKTVFDPFCGTGGFLTEAFRHLGQQTMPTQSASQRLHYESLYGWEITNNARIAKMNMILYGDGHSGVTQGNSLLETFSETHDYILSNIPFSLTLTQDVVKTVDPNAKDADEACLLQCFNSLKQGGAMAVVVPDGLVVNQSHKEMWRYLCGAGCIRAIASLPRGTFAPYTDAKTRIVYLTDKGTRQTDWFYDVTLNEGRDESMEMEEFQFFFEATEDPVDNLPPGVAVVRVANRDSASNFYWERPWQVDENVDTVPLGEIATLENGKTITEATAVPGSVPVIAGGRGTSPYTHSVANTDGGCCTISKSGAYSGYVWWHEDPIWASDSVVVRSRDESKFLSFYLYMCLKTKQEEIYFRQQGTGQPHVYSSHVYNFPIPVKTLEEQVKLVSLVRAAVARQLATVRMEAEFVAGAEEAIGSIYSGRAEREVREAVSSIDDSVRDVGGTGMATRYRLPYTLSEPSEETEDLYLAEVPILPGCRAWGETPELALEYLESVAEGFIASYQRRGKPLPRVIAQAGEIVVSG